MKRIAIFLMIAVLLCVGCMDNSKNTNDEKSDITSHSENNRETSSEITVTENVTSKVTENNSESVHTTVSAEYSLNDKEFVITEKIEENIEISIAANGNISPNITKSTTTDIMQESKGTTVSETKSEVIELPFVPVR